MAQDVPQRTPPLVHSDELLFTLETGGVGSLCVPVAHAARRPKAKREKRGLATTMPTSTSARAPSFLGACVARTAGCTMGAHAWSDLRHRGHPRGPRCPLQAPLLPPDAGEDGHRG